MKNIFRRWFDKCKSRIRRRLDKSRRPTIRPPQSATPNIHYEVSDKTQAITCGGIGLFHTLVRRLGLAQTIDDRLKLFKLEAQYRESDHVLNIAYNALCGGTCIQDIELRRNDAVYLTALGVPSIPAPTTAGDFCRRFSVRAIETLLDAINATRVRVWAEQPDSFFDCAILDSDGTLTETAGGAGTYFSA